MNKFALLALLGCLLHAPLAAAEDIKPFDQIAAVANNSPILLSEAQQRAQTTSTSLKQAVDALVLERLQAQQAKQLGLNVDENTDAKQVAEAVRKGLLMGKVKISEQEVKELISSQSGSLTSGERYKLQHILVATPPNPSVAQAKRAHDKASGLQQQLANGADFTQLAKAASDDYAAQQGGDLGWQAAEKLPESFSHALALMQVGEVSDVLRDASGFHLLKLVERQGGKRKLEAQTRVRHILVSTQQGRSDAEAKQKADALYQQLRAGGSFAKLAKENSDDPGSAAKGGDLGWTAQGKMVKPFEQVMDAASPNAVSPPFQTQFGWHILQVLERKQADVTGDGLRDKATNFLGERKLDEYYQAWLNGLRAAAHVEYRIPLDGNNLQLH